MNIETNFVPYQIALDMKLLGFDEPCLFYFDKDKKLMYCPHWFNNSSLIENKINISAPLYSQAFKFFRDKHNLFSYIVRETGINHGKIKYIGVYYKITEKGYTPKNTCVSQDTYEEAELACLINLIQNLQVQILP
jgi:hypothetical protein